MDGTVFDFNDWDKGQPQNKTGNFCGAVNIQSGQWSAENCIKKKPFVCLSVGKAVATTTTTKKAPKTTTTPKMPCLWGWTFYKNTGYCYNVFRASYQWLMAEESCTIDGAHLASIHSLDEAKFLAGIF